jgi:hypothetical protein
MPSLCDVAHEGQFCTGIASARSWTTSFGATGTVRHAGGTARPSRTKSHLPGHSPPATPASQAGRRVGPVL